MIDTARFIEDFKRLNHLRVKKNKLFIQIEQCIWSVESIDAFPESDYEISLKAVIILF